MYELEYFFLEVAKEGGFRGAFLNLYPRGVITLLSLERKKKSLYYTELLNYISERSICKYKSEVASCTQR